MQRWLTVTCMLWLLLFPVPGKGEESCTACHRDIKVAYEKSVHAEELSCTACHGGNPRVMDLQAHAADEGYVGKPTRAGSVQLCASCHSDPSLMKPYGLPTDQYDQYATSQHGLLLAVGNTQVAVCTDCHATHRILPSDEPTSTVSPRNIPATCGRCHSDQRLMASYNLPVDQVEKFRRSVHGIALFVEEHPAAPTCATCHGAHGAVPPQAGQVGKMCGHCHTRTRLYFNQGPHGKVMEKGEMSECESCHGHHDIAQPDTTLFDTACRSCHAQGSVALLTGQKLKTFLSRARESLEQVAREMVRVEKVFPKVGRYRSRLQQARAYYVEALPVQHALDVDRVEDLTRNARSISEDVRAAIHGVEEEKRLRYIGLVLTWVFILFTVAVGHMYKREKQRQRREP